MKITFRCLTQNNDITSQETSKLPLIRIIKLVLLKSILYTSLFLNKEDILMKKFYVVVLTWCLHVTGVHITHEIRSITELYDYIKPDEKVLVVFDIDNTLLEMHELHATPEWFDAEITYLRTQGMTIFEAVEIVLPHYAQALQKTTVQTVEPEAHDILTFLHDNNIYFLIVTKRSIIDVTHRQFEACTITTKAHHDWQSHIYDLSNRLPHPAQYDHGIIFVGNNEKGAALELFLQEVGCMPDHIVAIDDTASHLASLERMCKRMGIEHFTGLRYGFLDDKVAEYKKCHIPMN